MTSSSSLRKKAIAAAAMTFCVGVVIGWITAITTMSAATGPGAEPGPPPRDAQHPSRDDVEGRRSGARAQREPVTTRTSAGDIAEAVRQPADAGAPAPSASHPVREELIDPPGVAAGTATRSPSEGDRDWMWLSGSILPDRGGDSSRGVAPSVRIDAEHGTVSVVLPSDAVTTSDGFVALRFADSLSWRVVYRSRGADGLREAGGSSASLRRARDLAESWQIVAAEGRPRLDAPSVMGCSTLRFRSAGAAYTLVMCVEYGPDGNVTAVTLRDGR